MSTITRVHRHLENLNDWYLQIPCLMRLSTIFNGSLDMSIPRSLLFIHLIHYGTIVRLTWRYVDKITCSCENVCSGSKVCLEQKHLGETCITAAAQSANILRLQITEGYLYK